MLILFTIITFIFSSITILIIIFNWKSQCRSITNLLVCNSSAALIFYVIAITIQISFLFQTNNQPIDSTFCKIRAFIYLFACSVKSLSYLVQAISRWFITIHYKHRLLVKYRTNIIIIITSWIVSLTISAGMFISPLSYKYEPMSKLCVLTSTVFPTSFITILLVFLIPVHVIILLYGIILWHTTRIQRIHPHGFTEITSKRNLKVFHHILILVIILIVGGTPYCLSIIINKIGETPWPLYSLSIVFISLSASMESITIFYINQQVKTLFYNKIRCCFATKIAVIA